jgi:hypothetical protein
MRFIMLRTVRRTKCSKYMQRACTATRVYQEDSSRSNLGGLKITQSTTWEYGMLLRELSECILSSRGLVRWYFNRVIGTAHFGT